MGLLDFFKSSNTDSVDYSPTALLRRHQGGICVGGFDNVWLYRAAPLGPIESAKTEMDALRMMQPVARLLDAVAEETPVTIPNRNIMRPRYRNIHMLLVNVPVRFDPGVEHPLRSYLRNTYPDEVVMFRLLLVGVQLRDSIRDAFSTKEQIRKTFNSFVTAATSEVVPIENYEVDYERVSNLFQGAGFVEATETEFRIANSWWSWAEGRNPEVPMLIHPDHMHAFNSVESAMAAKRHFSYDCSEWPKDMQGTYNLTLSTVANIEMDPQQMTSLSLQWVPQLLLNNTIAVSIRGKLEPPKVTREHLRRRKSAYIRDIEERYAAGKLERVEQEEMLARINMAEADFSDERARPSVLMDSTITVCSLPYDISDGVPSVDGLAIYPLTNRQEESFRSMQIAWSVLNKNPNPYKHDLTSTWIAASGISSLSVVGDQTGALLGFTELDRQPAYVSPDAAANEDALPLMLIVGQTGSGKTLAAQFLGAQFARIQVLTQAGYQVRTPVVFIDPKPQSDHTLVVQSNGGRVFSLDDIIGQDGPLDPLRSSINPQDALNMASAALLTVNPWGDLNARANAETPLAAALAYGVSMGERCIGGALLAAQRDGRAHPTLVDPVVQLANSNSLFRAFVGFDSSATPLAVSDGITLIKVGNTTLSLPQPNKNELEMTLPERISLVLVRMMVFSSSNAVARRSGVVILDEAWTFLGASRDQIDALGRLARSQGVLPILLTQKVTDALNAGLAGYISRGLILPIQDPEEAVAACNLFKLEPTPERINRITANASLTATSNRQSDELNFESMRALRNSDGVVVRGTVGIYCDLHDRAVPVEIRLPDAFIALASTRPEDVARRRAAESA